MNGQKISEYKKHKGEVFTKAQEALMDLRECTTEELEVGLAVAAELEQSRTLKLHAIYRMILKGKGRKETIAFASQHWGITEKTADLYWAEACLMVKEVAKETQQDAMEWHLAARRMLLSEFHDQDDLNGALNTLKDLAKLQALYAQDKAAIAKAGLDETQASRERETIEKLGNLLSQVYNVSPEEQDESE